MVPTGYSFNLDGTNIYMTLATLFIAQALGVDLTLGQQITILLVAMLTSKGAAASPARASSPWRRRWPWSIRALVPGMAIMLGIDKFMSECRALTNIMRQRRRLPSWCRGGKASSIATGCTPICGQQIDPTDMETAVTTG